MPDGTKMSGFATALEYRHDGFIGEAPIAEMTVRMEHPVLSAPPLHSHRVQVLQDECRRGLCVLVPTHDTDLLLDLADRVLVLTDGRISPLTQAQQDPHHRVAAPERVAHA